MLKLNVNFDFVVTLIVKNALIQKKNWGAKGLYFELENDKTERSEIERLLIEM